MVKCCYNYLKCAINIQKDNLQPLKSDTRRLRGLCLWISGHGDRTGRDLPSAVYLDLISSSLNKNRFSITDLKSINCPSFLPMTWPEVSTADTQKFKRNYSAVRFIEHFGSFDIFDGFKNGKTFGWLLVCTWHDSNTRLFWHGIDICSSIPTDFNFHIPTLLPSLPLRRPIDRASWLYLAISIAVAPLIYQSQNQAQPSPTKDPILSSKHGVIIFSCKHIFQVK